MKARLLIATVLWLGVLVNNAVAQEGKVATERIAREWKNGPPVDEAYFPIG